MEGKVIQGVYVNPGNKMFSKAKCEDIFVDKTGLINFTNKLLVKERNKVCVTRPRRFGKSRAFDMLVAYYSCGCDSKSLFDDLKIAQSPLYLEHLNKHNVIRLNIQSIWDKTQRKEEEKEAIEGKRRKKGKEKGECQLIPYLEQQVILELMSLFPDVAISKNARLSEVLPTIHKFHTNAQFIFLIDEWDVLFRSTDSTTKLKQDYLRFLTGMFKGSDVEECIEMVYMTGILPIIKYLRDTPDQSLVNNFEEYSMLMPDALSEYVGFTESEVADLCAQWNMPLELIKEWYDGYRLPGVGSVYCPESVVMALSRRVARSYWGGTSAFVVVRDYINLGFPNLKNAVDSLVAGESVSIDSTSFLNNVNVILCVDDVLTLLVHYGYLSYQPQDEVVYVPELGKKGFVQIPNREAREQFEHAIQSEEWRPLWEIVKGSYRLMEDTWAMNETEVAKQIEAVHDYKVSNIHYNNEIALRGVINLAYIAADAFYTQYPELPTGKGFADIAFLPKKNSNRIPMILELKWDEESETALDQIKKREYHGVLKDYGRVLLVGISYGRDRTDDATYKKHHCRIELWENSGP